MASAERREDGATAVEYGLLVLLIAAILIPVVGFLGLDAFGLISVVCGGASPFDC